MDWYNFACEDPTGRKPQKTHEMPYTHCFDKKWILADESFGGRTVFQARRLFNAYLMRIGQKAWVPRVHRLFEPAPTDREKQIRKQSQGYVFGDYRITFLWADYTRPSSQHAPTRPSMICVHAGHPPDGYSGRAYNDPAQSSQHLLH